MKYIINDKIRFKKLLVIDHNGDKLGLLDLSDALNRAKEEGLDLIVVSSDPNSPVAKIADFGKLIYSEKKKIKEGKKTQQKDVIKEVQVAPLIAQHDLDVKIRNSIKWLQAGFKIKLVVKAFGRIGMRKEMIDDLVDRFLKGLEGYGDSPDGKKLLSRGAFHQLMIFPLKNNKGDNKNEKQDENKKEPS